MTTQMALRVISGALDQEFEELFRDHSQLVFRTAYSILRNQPDAEDVLQTLFLKVLERAVLPGRNPQAYFYRAAVNASLNIVRSRKKEVLTADFSPFDRQGAESSDDSADLDVRRDRIIRAIAQLKPNFAEILILHYAHDYSDAQIAKMLGKSRGSVAVTLYRARARLKRTMRVAEQVEETREKGA